MTMQSVEQYMDDYDRVYGLMTDRRALMEMQRKAGDAQGALVDAIRVEKERDPELVKLVDELEVFCPELYKYVRRLELINQGVYCENCNNIKHIPIVKDDNIQATVVRSRIPLETFVPRFSQSASAGVEVCAETTPRVETIHDDIFDMMQDKLAEEMLSEGCGNSVFPGPRMAEFESVVPDNDFAYMDQKIDDLISSFTMHVTPDVQ